MGYLRHYQYMTHIAPTVRSVLETRKVPVCKTESFCLKGMKQRSNLYIAE